MTPPLFSPALGYESPTEHTVTTALATNHLMHRLSELEQNQRQRQNVGQNEPTQEPVNMDDIVSRSEKMGAGKVVGVKDRIACFQWTWFTSTMATGGIANVISSSKALLPQCLPKHLQAPANLYLVPFQAQWLYIIGVIFFIFNMCLFTTISVLLFMKFRLRPGSFIQSFTDQFEALFIPASVSTYMKARHQYVCYDITANKRPARVVST